MATEQHANGTLMEEVAALKIESQRLADELLDANMAWASKCEEVAVIKEEAARLRNLLATRANRSASYTLEQIETAVRYANKQHRTRPQWGDDDVVNCVLTTLQPAPKTAEKRIKDVLIKHVYISGSKLQPSDELVSELLLAARKEPK
jgi:hypothetical protein